MKKYSKRTVNFVSEIQCDKCCKTIVRESAEFQECLSIDKIGAYAAQYGDGNRLHVDLCQSCWLELLKPFATIEKPTRKLLYN